MNHRYVSLIIVVCAIFLAFLIYPIAWDKGADFVNSKLHISNSKYRIPHFFNVAPFRLGLDLLGGTHLVYQADLSQLNGQSSNDAMSGVRDVIERRVNLFGVSEAGVQLSSIADKHRLTVELPGVADVNEAIDLIGQTAQLSFRGENSAVTSATTSATFAQAFPYDTGINGSNLVKATAQIKSSNSERWGK